MNYSKNHSLMGNYYRQRAQRTRLKVERRILINLIEVMNWH